MSNLNKINDNEINIRELTSAVWSHKLLIAVVTSLSIVIAGYHALNSERKYEATAIFTIEETSSNNFNIPSELNTIASLAGLSGSKSSSLGILLERIMSREFILGIEGKLNFKDDPYFNSYNPNVSDPKWKALIKSLIGWSANPVDENTIVEQQIIASYKGSISVDLTDGGAVSISVLHKNPITASNYANSIMDEIRFLVEEEKKASSTRRLSYLSKTLADALQDMEESQKKLKNFALRNSTLAQESFFSGSLKLEELRNENKEAEEFSQIIKVLKELIKEGQLNNQNYKNLRNDYPLVDDVNFRRILGMSESISGWSWPEAATLDAVADTLLDRIQRLKVEINDIEKEAQKFASSAEQLSRLKRDAKIAEATYTVLIEQVKSQSLVAGYRPDTFKVFEFSTPPIFAVTPKRNLILMVGAIIGLFVGIALSIASAILRGVFFNQESIKAECSSEIFTKSKVIRRMANWPIAKIYERLEILNSPDLTEIGVHLSKKKVIYIINLGSKIKPEGIANILALQSKTSGKKIAVCNISHPQYEQTQDKHTNQISKVSFSKTDYDVDILNKIESKNNTAYSRLTEFTESFGELENTYDQIFICTNMREALVGLSLLKPFKPEVVLLTRLRKTQKNKLRMIKNIQKVSVVLND